MAANPLAPTVGLVNGLAAALLSTRAGAALAGTAVSRWLTRRTRKPLPPLPDTARWTEADCHTADGVKLRGWIVEPTAGPVCGTVALFHGFRQGRGQVVGRAALLAAAGFRCVAFDHRAHGDSGGKLSSFGFHEREDVRAVADFARTHWLGSPTAALGISMGAAAVCYAAELGIRWDAVVLESVYDDILGAFRRRIGGPYPAWFGRVVPGVVRATERRLGLKMEQLTPGRHTPRLAPAPCLWVHGTADAFAPPAASLAMAKAYPGPAAVWTVPGAGHHDVLERAGDDYAREVVGFLRRAVGVSTGTCGTRPPERP
jgi:pimeloyl-ACP methyl ester carboxylesterase